MPLGGEFLSGRMLRTYCWWFAMNPGRIIMPSLREQPFGSKFPENLESIRWSELICIARTNSRFHSACIVTPPIANAVHHMAANVWRVDCAGVDCAGIAKLRSSP